MTNCPHCKKRCNPMRFLLVTKWTPYKCPNCKGKSQFSTYSASVLGGIIGFLSYFLYTYLFSTFDNPWYLNFFITVLPLTSIAILLQWLFFELKAE